MRARPKLSLPLCLAAVLLIPAAAHAARPSNDDRADAQVLTSLPASVKGSTRDATVEKDNEPFTRCGANGNSVWYRFTAPSDGRVVIDLQADGDLDAIVDVFSRERSQARFLDCDATDPKGKGAVSFSARRGASYLVRVSQLTTSVPGTFTLDVVAPQAPARPPGAALPAAGVTRTIDRVQNPDDAWSATFHAGTTYRVHLSGRNGRCSTSAQMYAPGTSSFDSASPVRRLFCGSYFVFTPRPGEGGRYSFLVSASRGVRGNQTYHLQTAKAGPDDTAPGVFVRNHARVHGSLRGGQIDVVDLYRFDVTQRSVTFLDLARGDHAFSLQLLDDRGHQLAAGSSIHRGTRPGRYFVAVRAYGGAAGRYTLRRGTRVITRTTTTISGGLGGLRVAAATTPVSSGPYEIVVERFDPLAGWLFAKRYRVRTGGASVTYVPRGVGRYRAQSEFLGTRDAAKSRSRFAYAAVGDALRQ